MIFCEAIAMRHVERSMIVCLARDFDIGGAKVLYLAPYGLNPHRGRMPLAHTRILIAVVDSKPKNYVKNIII